jgi:hypothetical protein
MARDDRERIVDERAQGRRARLSFRDREEGRRQASSRRPRPSSSARAVW